MPRTRSYDPDAVLDRAVLLFWEKGYADTSVQDLVDATQVQRYGLYETFGDKHGLFVAALRRYREVWFGGFLADLESPEASLPEILGLFSRLVDAAENRRPRGCLMCNTAAELGGADPEATEEVGRYVERLRSALRGALERAREAGQIPRSIDPATHAVYLAGVAVGASVLAKTPDAVATVATFVDRALDGLR